MLETAPPACPDQDLLHPALLSITAACFGAVYPSVTLPSLVGVVPWHCSVALQRSLLAARAVDLLNPLEGYRYSHTTRNCQSAGCTLPCFAWRCLTLVCCRELVSYTLPGGEPVLLSLLVVFCFLHTSVSAVHMVFVPGVIYQA